jgi:putative solute:sodium symporter small subunit
MKDTAPITDKQLTANQRQYWQKNLHLTAWLLAVWFFVTFVVGWFARDLQSFTLLGFPFSFYMGAQGSLIIYIAIIWFYAHRMNRLDHEYGVQEEEE